MFTKRMTKEEEISLYDTAHDISLILNSLQFNWWLSHGTLLGAWRHRGVIPWDDDLDIAFPRELLDVLIKTVTDLGWKHMRMGPFLTKIWNPKAAMYSSSYPWTWPFVDITLWDAYKDSIIIEYNHHKNFMSFKTSDILPTKLHNFGPLELPIPKNPQKLLDVLYPTWNTQPMSCNWSHRLEKHYLEVIERKSIKELKEKFCFFNVVDSGDD